MVLGQNLSQIRFNVGKKVKKLALSLGFFNILLGEYLLKQKSSGCKTTLMDIHSNHSKKCQIYRMLGPNSFPIWVKNGKKTDYFQ